MAAATELAFLASPSTGQPGPALAVPWLFTGEDNLRLMIINSQPGVTVTLDGRATSLTDSTPTPFVQSFTPTSDRSANQFDFAFGPGFLLNCSLIVTVGNPLVGQTYVMLQVIRGISGARLVVGCLLAGYITAMQHIAYPGSPIESSTAGEPYVRNVSGTLPAKGVEIAETVPTGARWELLAHQITFQASGVVATRRPYWRNTSGSARKSLTGGIVGITAGQAWALCWAPNLPVAIDTVGLVANGPTMQRPILLAGDVFGTQTLSLDPGDQYTVNEYAVREWLEVS